MMKLDKPDDHPVIAEWIKNAEADFSKFRRFDYVEELYRWHMENACVCIVGGSCDRLPDDIAGLPPGTQFVRSNTHFLRQGGECDVLYHTCIAQPDISPGLVPQLQARGMRFAFLNLVDSAFEYGKKERPTYFPFVDELRHSHPSCNIGFFAQGEWEGPNPYGLQFEWLNELHKKYETKLFTGLVALAHVLRTNVASVFVCGMDLFVKRTGGDMREKVESHPIAGNVLFLRDAAADPRVHLDQQAREALKAYGC